MLLPWAQKLKEVVGKKLDTDGNQDVQKMKKGRPKYDEDGNIDLGDWVPKEVIDSFPAYSNDLNAIIEKCWRELDRRVLARCGEIHTDDDMRRVMEEEWEELELDDSGKDRGWIGINAWADKWCDMNQAVLDADGFDTHYM